MSEEKPKKESQAEDPSKFSPSGDSRGQLPEPPVRYDPDKSAPSSGTPVQASRSSEYDSARRLIRSSQILSLVSLIIGGVVLSAASIIVAIAGYRKVAGNIACRKGSVQPPWEDLKRLAYRAIAMGAIALTANAAMLAMVYPMVLETLQTGDYASLWSDSGSGLSTDSSSSFWG